MKIVLGALMFLVAFASIAEAACPIGTRYQCYPTSNGKMQCGCY